MAILILQQLQNFNYNAFAKAKNQIIPMETLYLILKVITVILAIIAVIVIILTIIKKRREKKRVAHYQKESDYIKANKKEILRSGKKCFVFRNARGMRYNIYAHSYKEANLLHQIELKKNR